MKYPQEKNTNNGEKKLKNRKNRRRNDKESISDKLDKSLESHKKGRKHIPK